MMYCMCCDLCGLCVNMVLSYIIIVVGCITLQHANKSYAGYISLKVLEHDEEHEQVHETYLVAAVCVCNQSNVDWRSLRFIHLEEST